MTIKELDSVILTESLPALGLRAGDRGCVVLVHAGGAGYEVEFMTPGGETIAVATVPARAVRPVAQSMTVQPRAMPKL